MKLKTLVENGCLKHINLKSGNATFEVKDGEQYIWVTENTVLLELCNGGISSYNKTTIHCILIKKHVDKLLGMGMDYLLEKGVSVSNES